MHTSIPIHEIPLLAAGILSGNQALLLVVVLTVTTLSMIAAARRRREGGPSPRAYAREQIARLREEKGVHDDVHEVMAQLQILSREINAQLDAKFMRLERCIRDADERIARLDRANRRAAGGPALDVTVSDESPTPGGKPEAAVPSSRDAIITLADEGRSAADISAALGRPIGEVQLVLSLHRRAERLGVSVTV